MGAHWAQTAAEGLPDSAVVAAGISPSGVVHVGNLRDLLTAEAVHEAAKAQGKSSELLFFWDDFDRLRRVPSGIPDSFVEHVGRPYCDVPDPWGEFGSFAERFIQRFESEVAALGVETSFIRQSGRFWEGA